MSKEIKLSAAAEMALQGMGAPVSKSFMTGYNVGEDDRNGGNALRRESLEDEIKNATFGSNDFTIYPLITKKAANSTIEQYVVRNDYGNFGNRSYTGEIGMAAINNPQVFQKVVRMKYITDTQQASLPSLAVNNVEDPLEFLRQSSIMVVAKSIEYGIFYGDADLSAVGEGQGLQFDGLAKLVAPENVIDAKGQVLDEKLLNQASMKVAKGFGTATDAFMPIEVQNGFVTNQLNRQWIAQATGVNESGMELERFRSTRGLINLHGSTIMNKDKVLNLNSPLELNAPAAPVSVEAKVAAGAGVFSATDVAAGADYYVRVQGATGASAPIKSHAALTDTKSEVTLSVKVSNISAVRPDYVEVFRKSTVEGDAEFYLVGRVPMYKAVTDVQGTSTVTFIDKNEARPATSDVFVLEMSPEVLALLELIPMMMFELPQMTTSKSFAMYWGGSIALYLNKRVSILKNVAQVG